MKCVMVYTVYCGGIGLSYNLIRTVDITMLILLNVFG